MKRSAAARCGIWVSALLAAWQPAMGQHPRGGHPGGGGHPAGMMPHGGNAGMGQMHPHIQQQIHQQQQQAMRQQQQMMQQMQKQQHQQYQNDLQQFDRWLEANGHGGNGSAASRLPKDAAGFDRWAATQKQRKAQGKSYDALYDHFQSFTGSMGANQGRGGKARAGHAQSRTDGQQKREDARSEEHRQAERKREEERRLAGRRAQARASEKRGGERRVLPQDQAKVSLLRTVHTRLGEADRDYGGNRVHAMHSVSQAIQHLGGSTPAGAFGASSLGNLPQAQSDGILRDALHKLRNVESQLGGSAGGAPHHVQARGSVAEAIRHLEVALRVR